MIMENPLRYQATIMNLSYLGWHINDQIHFELLIQQVDIMKNTQYQKQ